MTTRINREVVLQSPAGFKILPEPSAH